MNSVQEKAIKLFCDGFFNYKGAHFYLAFYTAVEQKDPVFVSSTTEGVISFLEQITIHDTVKVEICGTNDKKYAACLFRFKRSEFFSLLWIDPHFNSNFNNIVKPALDYIKVNTYWSDQLNLIGEDYIKVKFFSEQGSTKHLNLTKEQFLKIKEFMLTLEE